jgi:hypothetical protein
MNEAPTTSRNSVAYGLPATEGATAGPEIRPCGHDAAGQAPDRH